jgi:ATP-dependent Lhr-like helicase
MSTDPTASRETVAFGLLHPAMQEQLYQMRWRQLRPIQVEAIHRVLEGGNHLVLAARTAGGKTEAAFLPILSRLLEQRAAGVRALYVGPLKALINDQFRRLEDLCARTAIPVHRWHGDVSQSAKKKLLDTPAGVLLITPESIESLFINHPERLGTLFGRLLFVVVDELHAFPGTERGAHLQSLLARLTVRSRERVRLLGLSATLGDDRDASRRWLCPHAADAVELLEDAEGHRQGYDVKAYLRRSRPAATRNSRDAADDAPDEAALVTEADEHLAEDLISTFYGKTALIFGNNKPKLEFYADLITRDLARQKRPNLFAIHHGSLSKAVREQTEEELRSDRPTATFCSSTLELGIDVGSVQLIGQLGAPWSVNSLTQRLGRSGRGEGETSRIRLFVEADEPDERSPFLERLFPELLQAIAMVELLREPWCEPLETDRLHASTLVQQILSVIAETGGARADALYDTLVTRGGFTTVDRPFFVGVLRSLGAKDLLEQAAEGELILGLQGERLVRNRDFYVAFQTAEEFRVTHEGQAIGSIDAHPGLVTESYVILAGRRWKVLEINVERREIVVEPSRGGRLPAFVGSGRTDVHPRVRRMMRELLFVDYVPPYLDPVARDMLARARVTAREAGLETRPFFLDGPDVIWFTWTGSRINRTLLALGLSLSRWHVTDDEIALTFEKASAPAVVEAYRAFLSGHPAPEQLARCFPCLAQEKYDRFLAEPLQAQVFAKNRLDVPGALDLIRRDAPKKGPVP